MKTATVTGITDILALLEAQRLALQEVAKGLPLNQVLENILRAMEALDPAQLRASILLLDKDRQRLSHAAAPSLPASYTALLNGIEIGPATGSCGTAAFRDEPVFVGDITTDPLWEAYRAAALEHGLRACWSMPIAGADGKTFGILSNYYPMPRAPQTKDMEIMAIVAHTVALAIERRMSDQALVNAEARHRQILNSARDFAVIGSDRAGRIISWNEGAQRILGWSEHEALGQLTGIFFTPEDIVSDYPAFEMRCALEQGFATDERWHRRRDGEQFWASGQLTPLKDDAGVVVGFVKYLRDRTEAKLAQDQLAHLNATLEAQVAQRTRERDRIWRNSLDLLLVIGADGVLSAVNPAWTAALGYEPEELVGRHFRAFVHPNDSAAAVDAITHALQAPLTNFEVRLRHKNGLYCWFEWRAVAEEGMLYGSGRDITLKRKQAESRAAINEMRLQLALEAGQMGAWQTNLVTNEHVWLYGMARLHGLDTEFSGNVTEDYGRYVHPEDRAQARATVEQAIAERRDYRLEYRIVWPDSSVHWIEGRGKLFMNEAGEPVQVTGICVDITRRKRIEHDLQFLAQASVELAGLIDYQSTLDKLAYLAVPTFADWCAVDILQEDGSLKRVAIAHIDPAKLKIALDFYRDVPLDPNQARGVWSVLKNGKSELVGEIRDELLEQIIPNPHYRALLRQIGLRSYIGVPLTAHGKTFGVVTFVTAESGRLYTQDDLSLAEDLARRAAIAIENAELYQTLQEADRAKDVFIATLAHELRNPLAPIASAIGILKLAGHDRERVAQSVAVIARQVSQLKRLVDDLMDVSRIATGKIELRMEDTSLADILASAIEISRPHIEAAGHTLRVSVPEQPTDMRADPVRLSQVFANLLNNAAKYTKAGGVIELALEFSDDWFIVRIKDNGIGIPPDMLNRVFEMFTQVTHPLERSHAGLGIGLSLVQGLLRLHGGTVEARSEGAGKGSEFIIRLPRRSTVTAQHHAADAAAAAARSVPAGTRRILVVDDNVDAASTTAELLRMLGHEVEMAHDGLAAVASAAAMQPDLVLLDIGLPGIDGYEVARRIRAQQGARRTSLIALTGWGQRQDRELAQQAGFDHHLVKPVGLEQLQEILRQY